MGYTADDDMVRVDFFKRTGKWYTTEAVRWLNLSDEIHTIKAFKLSLRAHLTREDGSIRLADMTAVCLEPYPLMIDVASCKLESE